MNVTKDNLKIIKASESLVLRDNGEIDWFLKSGNNSKYTDFNHSVWNGQWCTTLYFNQNTPETSIISLLKPGDKIEFFTLDYSNCKLKEENNIYTLCLMSRITRYKKDNKTLLFVKDFMFDTCTTTKDYFIKEGLLK